MDETKIEARDESTIVDELGVLSSTAAFGGGAAALFFHNGGGQTLNKLAIGAKIYSRELSNLYKSYGSDFSGAKLRDVGDALDRAKASYEEIKDYGMHFNASSSPVLESVQEWIKSKAEDASRLQRFYTSELATVGHKRLEGLRKTLPENVYSALASTLNMMAKDPNDIEKIYGELNSRLTGKNYTDSVIIADQILDDMNDWRRDNKFEDWSTNIGNKLIENSNKISTDFVEMKRIQDEKNKSLRNKVKSSIMPDKNITMGELLEIINGQDSEEKDIILGAFRNETVLTATSPSSLIKSGISENDIRVVQLREQKGKVGSFALKYDEILPMIYDRLDDKQKEAFRGLEIEGIVRDRNGKLQISADYKRVIDDARMWLGGTFPYKMLHPNDSIYDKRIAQRSHTFYAGTVNRSLAAQLGIEGNVLDKNVRIVDDKVYVQNGSNWDEVKDLRGKLEIHQAKTGIAKKINEKINDGGVGSKHIDLKNATVSDLISSVIEIKKQDPRFTNSADVFAAFNDDSLKLLTSAANVLRIQDNPLLEEYKDALVLQERSKRFTSFLKDNTFALTDNAINAIKNNAGIDGIDKLRETLGYLEDLRDGKIDEVVNRIMRAGSIESKVESNPDLFFTVRSYVNNKHKALESFHTKNDPNRYASGKYLSYTYKDILKEQLSHELMYNLRDEVFDGDMSKLFSFLNETLGGFELNEAKNLAAYGELKRRSDAFMTVGKKSSSGYTDFEHLVLGIKELQEENSSSSRAVIAQIQNMTSMYDFGEEGFENSLDAVRFNADDRLVTRKPVGFDQLKILKHINEGHLEDAFDEAASGIVHYARQFVSGVDDPKHFTKKSLGFFHIANSVDNITEFLGESLPTRFFGRDISIGTKISGKYSKSGLGMIKGFGLAIGGVVGAYNALDLLDDTSKEVVGMGTKEAALSGIANTYLGIKKFTGAVGLDDPLKSATQDNAFLNYVMGAFGDDAEWNTYEEEKHDYEKGYSAVRKARYWWFGSSNEYRGGKISYWKPGALREAASNYEIESVWNGSYFDKWNLLNRIYDPYMLEDMYSEDRPYPVSGSMFADNTPWGVILNSTIGNIIKPKKLLHQDRMENGVDIKALIYHMNQQIRDKSEQNMFYVQNGRLSSVMFNAYNAPTYSERIFSVDGQTDPQVYDNDYQEYLGAQDVSDSNYISSAYEKADIASQIANSPMFGIGDEIAIEAAKGSSFARMINPSSSSLNIIKARNEEIRNRSASLDTAQGMVTENKLSYERDPVDALVEDSEFINELMNEGSTNDYIQQMAISARTITGAYGYIANKITGFGDNKYERIATSADMTSFSREFWDAGYGGMGGNTMEIVRRFIPEYRRFQSHNPLMNTMPDWMPSRYRFGDPYTAVPMGEMRMPGKGYESLNELHPDIYGDYGAFDRFKILADIAPYSPEYKFWKRVASKTVLDPALKQEMKEIRARVTEQSRQHDFQSYKYVGRDVNRSNVYITEILKNGQFKIYGSDETFKLAGVRVSGNENETTEQVLSRYIYEGQMVQLVTDVNEAYGRNRDQAGSINAGIVVDGESIGELMLRSGDAVKRKSDTSAASVYSRHGTIVNSINWLTEAVMHADIPILHNRWLRSNDALENYLDDHVYGSSFQTWDSIIDSFILPNMQKAADSTFWTLAGISTDILRNNFDGDLSANSGKNLLRDELSKHFKRFEEFGPEGASKSLSGGQRKFLKTIHQFSDRGALMGGLIGKLAFYSGSQESTYKNLGRRLGTAATLLYSGIEAEDNAVVQMASWSRLAYLASNEFFGGKMKKVATLGGAAFGALRYASSVQLLSDDETADTYIPDHVRKRWEMQDYFDRLTYIKYSALFEKAAEKAESEEGVDIKAILLAQRKEAKSIKDAKDKIKESLRELSREDNTQSVIEMREALKDRLELLTPTKTPLQGGDYTKSAIMYYNAARATMYALDEQSSMADIVRALPKTERDYFMEFVKERDKEKREEILAHTSPQLRRALKLVWSKSSDDYEVETPESNESYFADRKLPGMTWAGWNPNVDLEDVKAKVIKNEAMNPSDFGIYSSQYDDESVINAPFLNVDEGGDGYLLTAANLQSVLSGMGLTGVNVNVEPSQDSTLEVIANVGRVVKYNVEQEIESFFGLL